MRNGLLISALLHGGALAFLLAGPVEIVDQQHLPPDLTLEMVFEAPETPPPIIEESETLASPEESVASIESLPVVDDLEDPVEAPSESEPPKVWSAPETAEALDEPVPESPAIEEPTEETAPPDPEPVQADESPEAADLPELAERGEPETAVSSPIAPDPDEPTSIEPPAIEPPTIAAAPNPLPPAPVPKRKPVPTIAQTESAQREAEPPDPPEDDAPTTTVQEEVLQAEAAPEPEPKPEPEPEPSPAYRTPTVTGALTPGQLLTNLAALRDEEAQARANPELWSVIRAVRAQVARCWLLSPAEARNPDLSIDIAVAFDKSGKLLKAEVQEVGRMVSDDAFKDFAMAAHSALKTCSPFDLPVAKFDLWQRFTMRFVPREPS